MKDLIKESHSHVIRVKKLSLTQINSVLSAISEDCGEVDSAYLAYYFVHGRFSKYNAKEFNSEVKHLTKWFHGNWEHFSSKKEFINRMEDVIRNPFNY